MIRPCRRPAARWGSARISSARSKSSSSSLRENCCDSTTCRSRVPIAMKKPPFRPRRTGLKGPFVAAKSTSEVDATLMRHAGQLAEDQRLRGYDAVHLAALTRLGPAPECTLASWTVTFVGRPPRSGIPCSRRPSDAPGCAPQAGQPASSLPTSYGSAAQSLHDRAQHQQADYGSDLAAQDYLVQVQRRHPAHIGARDHVDAGGVCHGAPTAAASAAVRSPILVLAGFFLTAARASASEDAGDRHHKNAVALYGLTEDAADGQRVSSLLQDFVGFHPSSIRRRPRAHGFSSYADGGSVRGRYWSQIGEEASVWKFQRRHQAMPSN